MARQEKAIKIYLAFFALTAVFLGLVAFRAHANRQLWQKSTYTVQTQREAAEETVPERKRINVNTASAQELEQLTGIGPVLAQEIVSYRDEHGAFSCPEDLLAVKGIGEEKLENIRAEIIFSKEEAEP